MTIRTSLTVAWSFQAKNQNKAGFGQTKSFAPERSDLALAGGPARSTARAALRIGSRFVRARSATLHCSPIQLSPSLGERTFTPDASAMSTNFSKQPRFRGETRKQIVNTDCKKSYHSTQITAVNT
jgi:hypothetical protein